jgi:hypothetical protein
MLIFTEKKMIDKKPKGLILWSGKSLLDGNRIMVIATGIKDKTQNEKTGKMIQTYILRRDIAPMLAKRLGDDDSICGDCKHRENSTCYVNLCHGPMAVYEAYHDDSYTRYIPEYHNQFLSDQYIRFGSYGDPAAVPVSVWENLANIALGYTGYTHQWKNCDQKLKNYCMASVDSIVGYMKEYNQAQSLGWRTFRIRESLENELMENEFVCPASKEAGVLTTCQKCNLCNGLQRANAKNPVITLHGDSDALGFWRLKRYIKLMKKIKNKKAWRRNYKAERKQFKIVCKF